LVALDAVVGAVHMALGGEDVAVALFGVVHFGRGGLKIARLFVDAPKRNLCARATPKTTMAITRSKCGRDTHPKAPPKAAPKNGATSASAARKQSAPKKRSAAKGPAVPKKVPKKARDRAWQLQLILGFEERPGPRDLPTDKNILLRELFAELDQLYETHRP
tara:strand:+ start:300 stop:785 length:486 start_codon:yes stop_codon:yes gene_type:complete